MEKVFILKAKTRFEESIELFFKVRGWAGLKFENVEKVFILKAIADHPIQLYELSHLPLEINKKLIYFSASR